MNIVGITGNLVADPELKATTGGVPVCSFTVAVKRPRTKDKTDFIDCIAWRERAEFVAGYFSKGKKIEISGYITTRLYGNEGSRRKATELVCEDIGFGNKKEDDDNANMSIQQPEMQEDPFKDMPSEDDLPF